MRIKFVSEYDRCNPISMQKANLEWIKYINGRNNIDDNQQEHLKIIEKVMKNKSF